MARRRDLRSDANDDRLDRLTAAKGYLLGENRSVEDVIASDAELLRSEGLDPTWPGLTERQ
jgi:hypothetical protein